MKTINILIRVDKYFEDLLDIHLYFNYFKQ